MFETLEKQLKEHTDKGNGKAALLGIAEYVAGSTSAEETQQALMESTRLLQERGLLPGLTLNGWDNVSDLNGTGFRVTDKEGNNGKEEYTLDPNTGIARDELGRVQAIYYPNGTVQRFDYVEDSSNLREVKNANGAVYKKNLQGKWELKDNVVSDATAIVDKDGIFTITYPNGRKEEHRPDGSATYWDKNDSGDTVVTKTVTPFDPNNDNRRTSHEFTYGAGGDVVGVKISNFGNPSDKSSQEWKKQSDGSWIGTVTDKAGNQTQAKSNAKFEVTKEGALIITNQDGSTEKYYPNGKSETRKPDGTIIKKNNGNQPYEVTYPNGKTTKIVYDNGKPSKLDINGEKYAQDANGNWTKNGAPTQLANVVVHASGDIELVDKNGNKELVKVDGSRVKADNLGRPTDITPPTGPIQSFTYDANGLQSFVYKGERYNRDPDAPPGANIWFGEKSKERLQARVSADPSGNVSIETESRVEYRYTDGSFVVKDKRTGQISYYDKNGAVVKVVAPHGSTSGPRSSDRRE